MRKLFLAILIVLPVIISIPLFAANTMPVAVMDLKPGGVPKLVSKAASDVIRSEFVNIANFEVAERSQINRVVAEQGLQMTGITRGNGVRVGRLLAVRKIVIGELNAIGENRFSLTIRIVDVETGVSEYSARDTVDSLDGVETMASATARKLAKRIVQQYKVYFTAKTRSDYYLRGIVPGWGQLYTDHDVKGYAFMGLFIAGIAWSGYSYYDYTEKKDDYDGLGLGTSKSTFNSKYNDYRDAADMVTYSLIGTGAIYLLNWLDILFFSVPDFDGSEKRSTAGTLFLDYNYSGPVVSALQMPERFLSGKTTGSNRGAEHYYKLGIGLRF